jgi:hypothetical protein
MTLEGCPRIAVLMMIDDIGRMSEDSSSDDDLLRTRILFFFRENLVSGLENCMMLSMHMNFWSSFFWCFVMVIDYYYCI